MLINSAEDDLKTLLMIGATTRSKTWRLRYSRWSEVDLNKWLIGRVP